ncbi:MAG: DASH family cryptochrome [Bacteroidetes bacterium]|nr:DASH family cryptochrome [Bacteroidota bacterium]
MRILIWHRNDLRLHDNPLYANLIAKDRVIPVFVLNPELLQNTTHGFPRLGKFRLKFLHETLCDLSRSLSQHQLNLRIFVGEPGLVIPQLVRTLGIDEVRATREHTWEEVRDEREVARNIAPVPLRLFEDRTLIPPERLPFAIGHLPDLFTEFRKKVEGYSRINMLLPDMPEVQPLEDADNTGFSSIPDDYLADGAALDSRAAFCFKGGETEALRRLDQYFFREHHVATYKETRNGLVGADYSTRFSPWLANGSLSPRKIYHELRRYEKQYGSSQNTYWVFFELLWRDYFRFVAIKYGNRIFKPGGIKNTDPFCPGNAPAFERWRSGNTGNDFVDANMRELLLTGWMSNRGRQNVASYLVKDMKICWLDGAAWFESQLIDYDVCSNYVNWMYVAGVGNDPRENRYFNTRRQAEMYDPEGTYRRIWLG